MVVPPNNLASAQRSATMLSQVSAVLAKPLYDLSPTDFSLRNIVFADGEHIHIAYHGSPDCQPSDIFTYKPTVTFKEVTVVGENVIIIGEKESRMLKLIVFSCLMSLFKLDITPINMIVEYMNKILTILPNGRVTTKYEKNIKDKKICMLLIGLEELNKIGGPMFRIKWGIISD